MDILSGSGAVEAFQKTITDALQREQSEWSPTEFKDQTRLNAHQSAFAEHFAIRAPGAWQDLLSLKPIAIEGFAREWRVAMEGPTPEDVLRAGQDRALLNAAVTVWSEKYKIDTSWVQMIAIVTLRALALHEIFSVAQPSTLLFNEFPTLTIRDGNVELGEASFTIAPYSSVVVCADQGLQEWDTLKETKAQFRKRVVDSFTQELDEQLSRAVDALIPEDLEVHWHHIDISIERYAGAQSIRALATKYKMSRPGVSKAIEKTRVDLGLEKLPETWGATPIRKWELHATGGN